MIQLGIFLFYLWLFSDWTARLAEKGSFAGKTTRGALGRALFFRVSWRFWLLPLALTFLIASGDGGQAAVHSVALMWFLCFLGWLYLAFKSYRLSKYFHLPDPEVNHDPSIYIFQNETKTGPFTQEQFERMFKSGKVDGKAKYWHAGMDGWKDVIPSP